MKVFLSASSGLGLVLAIVSSNGAMAQDAGAQNTSSQPAGAVATPVSDQDYAGDIIVTAQRRSERINDVPLTITAITGDALTRQGIRSTEDLQKLVPSLNATRSSYGTPVYTLRGVGYYDTSLSASPTVSVYVDEVPLPFSIETKGAVLDLERVEVLKGPQGTLYGSNSTGGAINYVAAKPTDHLSVGGNVSVGSFDAVDAEGFVSGPISSTLSARLAVKVSRSGPWQQSTTRDDRLGRTDMSSGRFILEWKPDNATRVTFNANGFLDRSDSQAGQYFYLNSTAAKLTNALANEPIFTSDARKADWDPGLDPSRHDNFYQLSLRAEHDLSPNTTLTSISHFTKLDVFAVTDADGTAVNNYANFNTGHLRSLGEELRLNGLGIDGRLNWTLGGSYEHDYLNDSQLGKATVSKLPFPTTVSRNLQRVDTFAGFGNADFKVTDTLKLFGGLRYNWQNRSFEGCTADSGDGTLAAFQSARSSAATGKVVVIPPGGCATLGPNNLPELVHDQLNQGGLSWRGGIDFKPAPGVLLYASVSRGFKNGNFGTGGALLSVQTRPAVQESVTDYEAGFKATIFGGTVQLNAAGFYYDYRNKQTRGRFNDPVLGQQSALINIPKSHIAGAEGDFTWNPNRDFRFNVAATYVFSRIDDGFTNINPFGGVGNFEGEAFPFTPRFQITGDIEKDVPLSATVTGFAGASGKYQSSTNAAIGDLPQLAIKGYNTIDLRLGIRSPDSRWSVYGWARNVGNTYYYTSVITVLDTVARYAGMPRTVGIAASFRY